MTSLLFVPPSNSLAAIPESLPSLNRARSGLQIMLFLLVAQSAGVKYADVGMASRSQNLTSINLWVATNAGGALANFIGERFSCVPPPPPSMLKYEPRSCLRCSSDPHGRASPSPDRPVLAVRAVERLPLAAEDPLVRRCTLFGHGHLLPEVCPT